MFDTNCFDDFFLFHVITRRQNRKILSLLWHFLKWHIVAFTETSVFERNPNFMLSPQ